MTPLLPLLEPQAASANPDVHAWVAASAGTGKTQVLTARVLRLLLAGAAPSSILCLTFTKLAAAEMQDRVMTRLAHWAGCAQDALASDLAAIGAPTDADTADRARRLFAAVLETPAGLAIQTIHSFAQSLIASFPVEAGITPGFATLDDRAAALMRRRVLAEALAADDDHGFAADVGEIAIDGGEARLAEIMAMLPRHGAALAALRVDGVEALLRRKLELPERGDGAAEFAAQIAELPWEALADMARALGRHDGKNAQKLAEALADVLGADDKPAQWERLWRLFFSSKNEPLLVTTLIPKALDEAEPELRGFCAHVQTQLLAIQARHERWQMLDVGARHLRVAVRLAQDWARAKHHAGVIDYDDMIAAAARLLGGDGAAQWVRFKLDSRIDHVLVDEAQDTNLLQWEVIGGLVEEFFDGLGQRDRFRSLFVVGDFKQSIFGFQGADPLVYADRRQYFAERAQAVADKWVEQPLTTNFRSVPAILSAVDRVIDAQGHALFLPPAEAEEARVPPHQPSEKKAGLAGEVRLWPAILPENMSANGEDVAANGSDGGHNDDRGDDETPPGADIDLARRIAQTVRGWTQGSDLGPQRLILPASGRPAMPQDVLILVRRRSRLMNALVGALHEAQVPVAGADRLNLAEPLAVLDLVALVRFALQPLDDLNLAALLVSPLCGLSHDDLAGLAIGRTTSLWAQLLAADNPAIAPARDWLRAVQALSAEVSPYRFLEIILSGPLQGRARLLARLGEEARDAIDTVLDQALACERAGAASLQAFLAWMAAEELEVKRDPEAALDAVRLMTVHGAKGLQAPIVILADACAVAQPRSGAIPISFDNGPELPLWLPGGLVAPPPFVQAALDARKDMATREDRRLLYVALTRAEELLCIGGVTRPTKKHEVPPTSWYAAVAAALPDADAVDDPLWPGPSRVWRQGTPAALGEVTLTPAEDVIAGDPWWTRAAPEEARPPRPLAPSAQGPDTVAQPPPDASRRAAARRGTALHRLFETLPSLPAEVRATVGSQWCALNVADLSADELVDTVLAVLDDPAFSAVFAADALTEAPVAAVVGEAVIAGSIDRLLVTDDAVLAVDFKTGLRVPTGLAEVPEGHVNQMAAYAAALARVFPGRQVRAALLYTSGPCLIELPGHVLAAWQPSAALQPGQATPIYPSFPNSTERDE